MTSSICITSCDNTPIASSPECEDLAGAHANALIANHVYHDPSSGTSEPPLPGGFLPMTGEELAELTGGDLKAETILNPAGSEFRASVYKRKGEAGEREEYVVAYRGTQGKEDWKTSFKQGMGMKSDHYDRAVQLAAIMEVHAPGQVRHTGHSLGGGLASASSAMTGAPATTFNSAGLHTNSVGGGYPETPAPVDAYYVPGEMLSMVQDNRGAALAATSAIVSIKNPVAGFAFGAYTLKNELEDTPILPQAYGERHPLPVSAPSDKGWFDRRNPVDKHGMDWIVEGIEEQQRASGCI